MVNSRNQDEFTEALLPELFDSRNESVWRKFVRNYGGVLMSAARHHGLDPHDSQDCFLHICEKLCEDDFRRLRAFDPSRGGSFRTWLTAIAANLSADWCRTRYGRQSMPLAIKALPDLEQRVFRLAVIEGLDWESCLIGVRQRYPEIDRGTLSAALAAVHSALTAQQRWKYTVFRQRGRILAMDSGQDSATSGEQPDPLECAATDERRAKLRTALEKLTAQQRLIIRLRYEQELTLEEVAAVAGLGDLHQARRMIQAAIRQLSDLVRKADFL